MQKKKTIKKKYLYLALGVVLGIMVGLIGGYFFMRDSEKVDEDVFIIESLYCDMYYPVKWEDKIIIEEELNAVHFSCDLGEGKCADLFDMVVVETTDDEKKDFEVHVVMFDLEFGENWNDDEKQTAIEMQEDVGYVIEFLKKDGIKVVM